MCVFTCCTNNKTNPNLSWNVLLSKCELYLLCKFWLGCGGREFPFFLACANFVFGPPYSFLVALSGNIRWHELSFKYGMCCTSTDMWPSQHIRIFPLYLNWYVTKPTYPDISPSYWKWKTWNIYKCACCLCRVGFVLRNLREVKWNKLMRAVTLKFL